METEFDPHSVEQWEDRVDEDVKRDDSTTVGATVFNFHAQQMNMINSLIRNKPGILEGSINDDENESY